MQTLAAPQGQEFVLGDGTRVPDLETMYRALHTIPDDEFSRFVTPEKNDIASWIEHSLDDRFLAAALRRASTRDGMLKRLFIHLFA